MRRLLLVGMLVVLALASLQMVGAGPTEQEQINVLQTQVSDLRAIHGLTETATLTATATDIPDPTTTPEPTATATPEPVTSAWHSPTDHEHGDAPPAWAEAWSLATFGHGVVYGGDESTPNENDLKHEGFKGYAFTAQGDDGSTVEVYARMHMMTMPLGRDARYHSCEWYFRDASGAVSFMQWWCDFGDERLSFAQAGNSYQNCLLLDPGVRETNPLNVIISYSANSNPGYGVFCNTLSGKEFWYAQVSPSGDWMPTLTIDVYDPLTFTEGSATGDYALDRRVGFRWIAGGSSVTNIQGQPYLTRNTANPRGWFCSTVHGAITSMGSQSCPAGSLPQYIAPSLPTIGDEINQVAYYRNQWSCPSCSGVN